MGKLEESEYLEIAESLFEAIESQCDEYPDELDAELQGGVVTIVCEATGSQVIVSRQVSTREIWLAAKSGAFHFAWDGKAWCDTKGAGHFDEVLSSVLSQQANCEINFTLGSG